MSSCLVIEDSQAVREIMCRLLEGCGCRTEEAEGPAGALALMRETTYEALFLDWDLPNFGALEVLRELNGQADKPDIILCVTHNDPRELALARAAGGGHILMKPYDEESVGAAVRAIGQRAADEEQQSQSA